MTRKTEGVRLLAQEVLSTEFSEPYGEEIILDAWFTIEANDAWRRRYETLKDELTENVVNQWIPKYVKKMTGLNTIQPGVPVKEGHIVTAYTKLG